MGTLNRRTWWLLGLILISALAMRLGFCHTKTGLGRPLPLYSREYIMLGERLIEHGTIVSPLLLEDVDASPSALLPPVYTVLVAGIFSVLGVESIAAIGALQLINALMTTAAAACVFFAVRRLWGSSAALLAALIMAVNPVVIGFTHLIWDTSLFTVGVAATVWIAAELSLRKRSGFVWLAYGLWLGGLAMINPALTVAYPMLVLWPLHAQHGLRTRPVLQGVALTVVGWLVAITPWTVRNYHHFGELMYIRSGFMEELWLGVCPEADIATAASFVGQFPLLNNAAQLRVLDVGEQEFIRECGVKAKRAIAHDPWRFGRLSLVRMLDYWAGTLYCHRPVGHSGWPQPGPRLVATLFMLGETVLIVVWLVVLRGRDRFRLYLAATALSFSIAYAITHTAVRFRTPIEPVLSMLTALACVDLWRSWFRPPREVEAT